MPTVRLHLTSALSAPQVMAILTDFSSARPDVWLAIDAEHFQVHALGGTWAEVTEGTASAWERARYEWDGQRHRVAVTERVYERIANHVARAEHVVKRDGWS